MRASRAAAGRPGHRVGRLAPAPWPARPVSRRRPAGWAPRLGRGDDRGQVAVEFLGMAPVVLVTLAVLWQCVLVGYAFVLAGHAADEAVRAATATHPATRQGACRTTGLERLPGGWRGDAEVLCATADDHVTAEVRVRVPVLFPGAVALPFEALGRAGAVEEETGAAGEVG
ncbi:pilus assembly protein [Streptomyces sp. ZYX-F-203]